MTGAVLATINGGASGGSGTPTMAWSDIFSDGAGATNFQTVSGVTGTITMSATLSSTGSLHYVKNSTLAVYSGPFPVVNGDAIMWEIGNFTTATAAGTVTVNDDTSTTLIDTFNYRVRNSL